MEDSVPTNMAISRNTLLSPSLSNIIFPTTRPTWHKKNVIKNNESDRHSKTSTKKKTPSENCQRQKRGSEIASTLTKKKIRIKRPMNSFMIWARLRRKHMKTIHPDLQNSYISKRLGEMWRYMSDAQKAPYRKQANFLKLYHGKSYPGYRFTMSTPSKLKSENKKEEHNAKQVHKKRKYTKYESETSKILSQEINVPINMNSNYLDTNKRKNNDFLIFQNGLGNGKKKREHSKSDIASLRNLNKIDGKEYFQNSSFCRKPCCILSNGQYQKGSNYSKAVSPLPTPFLFSIQSSLPVSGTTLPTKVANDNMDQRVFTFPSPLTREASKNFFPPCLKKHPNTKMKHSGLDILKYSFSNSNFDYGSQCNGTYKINVSDDESCIEELNFGAPVEGEEQMDNFWDDLLVSPSIIKSITEDDDLF